VLSHEEEEVKNDGLIWVDFTF